MSGTKGDTLCGQPAAGPSTMVEQALERSSFLSAVTEHDTQDDQADLLRSSRTE
jgi:hypothetical protein